MRYFHAGKVKYQNRSSRISAFLLAIQTVQNLNWKYKEKFILYFFDASCFNNKTGINLEMKDYGGAAKT